MSNPNNSGVLIGRLARDPRVFENNGGSKKVLFTVYADRNYTDREGNRGSDAVPVEVFISDRVEGTGPYAHIHKGDLVALQTTLQVQSWEKNGETVFETKVIAENVTFLESRATTQARLEERLAQAQAENDAVRAQAQAGPSNQAEQSAVQPGPAPMNQAALEQAVPSQAQPMGEQLPFGG